MRETMPAPLDMPPESPISYQGQPAVALGARVGAAGPSSGQASLAPPASAAWPEAATATGVEDLSFVPFEVECFTYPRDSHNLDEFLDMVADRFGDESEEAAG